MSTVFSSPENACLEREVEASEDDLPFEQIWLDEHQGKECTEWINRDHFTKVALQFPDNYLRHSTKIYEFLEKSCEAKFFILADTSYGSCCVDEIAAAHVEADAIIHFGNACLSKSSRLPVFYCFPRLPCNLQDFLFGVEKLEEEKPVSVYLDIGYQYLKGQLQSRFENKRNFSVYNFPSLEDRSDDSKNSIGIFIGVDNQTLFSLTMQTEGRKWYLFNPEQSKNLTEIDPKSTKWLRRRYFYIEKLKDAQTVGLIVATLTADGYLDVVTHIQKMARAHGIRTHIISVGRINPAKLANFMEIDCFVLIGCPFNTSYISKEFFKPIVSVFEAELALNPARRDNFSEIYATNFRDILPHGKFYQEFRAEKINLDGGGDVSLLTGKVRSLELDEQHRQLKNSGELIERKNFQLMQRNVGANFEDRSWQGLEQQLGRTEPVKIEKGLSGIPTKYTKD